MFYVLAMLFAVSQASVVELSPQEKLLERFFGKGRRMGEVIPKINQADNKPITLHVGLIISHIYDIVSSLCFYKDNVIFSIVIYTTRIISPWHNHQVLKTTPFVQ